MNRDYNCRGGQGHHCHRKDPHRRGPSSFHMHDPAMVFGMLALKKGDAFLDLGCGAGDYSLRAAEIVGDSGSIYALDLWPDMLNKICEEGAARGLKNIHPVVSDIRRGVDMPERCIDVCLVATVLHTLNDASEKTKLFTEIKRVLKPGGKLAIIECKKGNRFGPPMHMRISPEELEKALEAPGFIKTRHVDLGTNYMALFTLNQ